MQLRVVVRFALIVAVCGTAASSYGYWPYGLDGGLVYRNYSQESVPYFALNPPVYYSRVVPRPYGWSPFPLPPVCHGAWRVPSTPYCVANPFVPGFEHPPAVHHAVFKRINNPFVEGRAVETARTGSSRSG